MAIKSIDEFNFASKKVLVRVDFNVPIEQGEVKSDARLKASLPTINKLLSDGAAVILISHLGRPKGKRDKNLSLQPVAKKLSELLDKEVKFFDDCIGAEISAACKALNPGEIVLLENLRFHAEEKTGDEEFGKELARLADFYVSDAFATAHRAAASMVVPPKYLPSAAGYLMAKEIEYLGGLFVNPKKPVVAILGGAKVSDKLPILKNLAKHFDTFCIGGAMSYTFLKAEGKEIGASRFDAEHLNDAKQMLTDWQKSRLKLILPSDHVVADSIDSEQTQTVEGNIPEKLAGFDIGAKTAVVFANEIKNAGTVLFNGPVGVFEKAQFSSGTRAICQALSETEATTIVGGGDAVAAVEKFEVSDKISHISTGGGAALEFLEGKTLPGIAALDK